MEVKEVNNQVLVDLEKADCVLAREDTKGMDVNSVAGHARAMREGSSDDLVSLKDDKSHHTSFCSSQCGDSIAKNGDSMSSNGEMKVGLSDNSVGDMKKMIQEATTTSRTTFPLDPADQKLINELSLLC
jgi:hypothetical protein